MRHQAQKCAQTSSSRDNLKALLLCLACATVALWLYAFAPRLPFDSGITPQQTGVCLCMVLLLGLWMLRAIPALFGVLLTLLVMSLLGLVPVSTLLAGAANDAVLWWLGALSLSVAARESGLLGWLGVQASRSLSKTHPASAFLRRMPAVLWLALAFAMLPSPRQAAQWRHIFSQLPGTFRQTRVNIAATAQLCACLAWLPARPANLLILALLPAGGLDRFAPLYWWLHTWPLLILAIVLGIGSQWTIRNRQPANTLPATTVADNLEDNFAMRSVVGIALACVLATALQPLHGIGPGLLSVFAVVALSALHCVTPASLQYKTDWPLFVSATVLPGLMTSFAQALPELSSPLNESALLAGSIGAGLLLPAMLCLRAIVPARVLMLLSLTCGLAWSAQYDGDLLECAVPILVALHLTEFMLHCLAQHQGRWQRIQAILQSPLVWLGCPAYYLWCKWCG